MPAGRFGVMPDALVDKLEPLGTTVTLTGQTYRAVLKKSG